MLSRLNVSMITAPATAAGKQVKVEDQRLSTGEAQSTQPQNIKSGRFDPILGVLTLEYYDGTITTVTGFPSENNLPQGLQGEPGDPGRDGRDGRDGAQGPDGQAGCDGREGERGATGAPGKDGRPGRPGPVGMPGPDGNPGPRGREGPRGKRGPTGPTGPTGVTGPTGPTGNPGPPGVVNIVVSATDPGNVAAGTIWVNPNVDQPPVWI